MNGIEDLIRALALSGKPFSMQQGPSSEGRGNQSGAPLTQIPWNQYFQALAQGGSTPSMNADATRQVMFMNQIMNPAPGPSNPLRAAPSAPPSAPGGSVMMGYQRPLSPEEMYQRQLQRTRDALTTQMQQQQLRQQTISNDSAQGDTAVRDRVLNLLIGMLNGR